MGREPATLSPGDARLLIPRRSRSAAARPRVSRRIEEITRGAFRCSPGRYPRPAPSRRGRLAQLHVGTVRKHPPRKVLPAHDKRTTSAAGRTEAVERMALAIGYALERDGTP